MTYRLGAHSSSDDPSGYRNKSEEDTWRAKCPVLRFKNWLIQQAWWDENQDSQRKQLHRDAIMAAMKKAEKIPAPPLQDLFTDVYDTLPWHLQEQQTELISHIRKYPQAYVKTAGRLGDE